jgi:hypothetical protein
MFKDTIISASLKKQELHTFLYCFGAAFIFNIVGILMYKSPAKELFTQLHVVLLLSVFFYLLLTFFRVLIWIIKLLVRKIRS